MTTCATKPDRAYIWSVCVEKNQAINHRDHLRGRGSRVRVVARWIRVLNAQQEVFIVVVLPHKGTT